MTAWCQNHQVEMAQANLRRTLLIFVSLDVKVLFFSEVTSRFVSHWDDEVSKYIPSKGETLDVMFFLVGFNEFPFPVGDIQFFVGFPGGVPVFLYWVCWVEITAWRVLYTRGNLGI